MQGGCSGVATQRFETALARQDSATAALQDWCARHRIANPARISARQVKGADVAPPPTLATILALSAQEQPGYRHVQLNCGNSTLSEAHNWYVPSRLTAEMNQALAQTDVPFGKITAPLGYRRERLSETRGPAAPCPADTILSHRARLLLPDGQPLALVVECYTRANLKR